MEIGAVLMKEFQFALRQTIPIFFTYVFIGIAFGILMSDAGYGVAFSAAAAVFIFAGSMQLVMVPMLASGASLFTLALTALLINARHIFYGLGFIEKFRRMGVRYPYMILTRPILASVRSDTTQVWMRTNARFLSPCSIICIGSSAVFWVRAQARFCRSICGGSNFPPPRCFSLWW